MAPRSEQLLRHLRRLVSEREPEPDAVLLNRFVKERDEAAFAELVRRHGAMVLGVCRRVLHDEHQAEDALQATFLLLAKKAATVRPTASLAAWLHTVARHLALKCRRTEERRRLRETARAQSPAVAPPCDPLDELTARELLHILDEEIQRLSEVYRLPLILCALEGLSVEEAARQLAWAPGSVRGRLARGRARLHARLARRGVMLPAGAIAALLAPRVEASLSTLAVKAMTDGTGISSRAAELAEGGLRGMTRTKLKIGMALLLTTAVAGAGGLAYQAPPAEQPVTNQQAESAKSQAIPKERTDLYGDPLPRGAVARLGTVRFRLGGLFYACAYSPDGKTLAAGSDDAVHLFDAATGKPIRQLRLGGYITSVACSPDGKTLAAGRECGLIQIWDLATGKFLRQFGDPTNSIFPLRSLAFTPDGKKLISGGGGNRLVYLWDPATGKELRRFTGHPNEVGCMALSPDGRTIASASADEVRLWEMDTGKLIRRLTGQKETIRALAFSPDGKLLASASEDHPTWLWEVATGKVRRRFPDDPKKFQHPNRSLAFSPDGKILANGCSDHTLLLWDAATGKKLREIAGVATTTHQGWNDGGIQCVFFSRDGRRLAFGQDNRLALLDVPTGEEVLPLPSHRGSLNRVLFSPDGQRLFTTSNDPIRQFLQWDATTGRIIRPVPGKATFASLADFSPDWKTLATNWNGQALYLWDTATGKEIRRVPLPLKSLSGTPMTIRFSPDGKLLAVSGSDGDRAWLYDVATGKQICAVEGGQEGKQWAGLVAFSQDGRRLAAAGYGSDAIYLAEVPSGRLWLRISLPKDRGYVSALAFAPDGRTLAVPLPGFFKPATVTLWEAASGQERLTFPVNGGQMLSAAFSPNGRLLATGGYDSVVHLWDAITGKQVRKLEGHQGHITSLTFSPDGRRLASASKDTTVLVWDVPPAPKESLRSAPLATKELETMWSDLAQTDAAKAYQAMLKLESAPEQAVPLLAERLRPKPNSDAERIARLLNQLDSDTFAERERAMKELRQIGWAAEPALRKVLEDKRSLEMRKRVNELLAAIRGTGLPPEVLQLLRSVEVLEHINTATARQLLRKLAESPLPEGLGRDELRREVDTALQRLATPKP